jgi:hypothetical protein
MNAAPSNTHKYRYERKFIVSELTQYEIETLVKLHPAIFLEAYPPRFVNNLYFDSPDRQNYFNNVDGLKDRAKVRIRWYGDLFGNVEKPMLELKIKKGLVGKKESFPLIPFSIDEKFQLETIINVFKQSDIPDSLKLDLISLEIVLLNRYRRKYFQSADRRYRITIDTDMEFYQVRVYNNIFLHKSVDLITTVVELKYAPAEDQHIEQITNYFPFRMTKSSKYVNGIKIAYF